MEKRQTVSMGGDTNSNENESKKLVNEITDLLLQHYLSFLVEDELFSELKKQGILYAERNEVVRLGAFRVLLWEAHKRVHGSLEPRIDLAIHGVAKERLEALFHRGRNARGLHHGIDYAALIEYPAGGRRIIVPLFVIAKSSPYGVREIRLKEAIEEALRDISLTENARRALENIPKFTRIALTRTVDSDEEARCEIGSYQGIPVYSDIACDVAYIVLKDIPEAYRMVLNDKALATLGVGDWFEALLSLATPLQIVVASSASPPSPPPGGISIADQIVVNVRREVLRRAGLKVQQVLDDMKEGRLAEKLKSALERRVAAATKSEEEEVQYRIALTV